MTILLPDGQEHKPQPTGQALAQQIIDDITSINHKLVEYQVQYASNLEAMQPRLEELKVDATYIMSYIKAMHIINANIANSPDFEDTEEGQGRRHSSLVGANISTAILFSDLLKHLSRDEAIEAIAIATNLITIVEFNGQSPTEE